MLSVAFEHSLSMMKDVGNGFGLVRKSPSVDLEAHTIKSCRKKVTPKRTQFNLATHNAKRKGTLEVS